MKNKETNKIKECYSRLSWCFDSVSYHKHCDRALDLSLQESKRHDRFRGNSISRGISLITEAKYFVIKRVAEYIQSPENRPDPANYLSIQQSCFACYAIAQSGETFAYARKWFDENKDLIVEICAWDYCDLIKTEDRRRGFKSSPASEVEA